MYFLVKILQSDQSEPVQLMRSSLGVWHGCWPDTSGSLRCFDSQGRGRQAQLEVREHLQEVLGRGARLRLQLPSDGQRCLEAPARLFERLPAQLRGDRPAWESRHDRLHHLPRLEADLCGTSGQQALLRRDLPKHLAPDDPWGLPN